MMIFMILLTHELMMNLQSLLQHRNQITLFLLRTRHLLLLHSRPLPLKTSSTQLHNSNHFTKLSKFQLLLRLFISQHMLLLLLIWDLFMVKVLNKWIWMTSIKRFLTLILGFESLKYKWCSHNNLLDLEFLKNQLILSLEFHSNSSLINFRLHHNNQCLSISILFLSCNLQDHNQLSQEFLSTKHKAASLKNQL